MSINYLIAKPYQITLKLVNINYIHNLISLKIFNDKSILKPKIIIQIKKKAEFQNSRKNVFRKNPPLNQFLLIHFI